MPTPSSAAAAALLLGLPLVARAQTGFNNPTSGGGSWLTSVPNTFPEGLGEPLNTVLSSESDSLVLDDSQDGGFLTYMLSLNFGGECLGFHQGNNQSANLGDGQGERQEATVLRYNFGDQNFGTCRESNDGGNHLRYWKQDGTNAIFMAVSVEMSADQQHDIVVDGYNLGRNYLVGNATKNAVSSPSDSTTGSGTTTVTIPGSRSDQTWSYQTELRFEKNLLNASSDGVNHASTVGTDGNPPVDGLVAVLTVKITEKPEGKSTSGARPSLGVSAASLTLAGLVALALGLAF